MPSSIGFGGLFLRANDPKALYAWYERHLGLVKSEGGSFAFPVPTQHPEIVFSFFKQDNAYFPPSQKAMINLQVDDLDGVLERLINEGRRSRSETRKLRLRKVRLDNRPRRQSRRALAAYREQIGLS